jgi:hypothetical protein
MTLPKKEGTPTMESFSRGARGMRFTQERRHTKCAGSQLFRFQIVPREREGEATRVQTYG